MTAVYFDDSLPVLAGLVKSRLGDDRMSQGVFLRGPDGRLSFVVSDDVVSDYDRQSLNDEAVQQLGSYADESGHVVVSPGQLFQPDIIESHEKRQVKLSHPGFSGIIDLLDRRIVGADWLQSPAEGAQAERRLAFCSLKGGVGRSTALCVVASHFAGRGYRVLTIDLDLEAPGLGNMLLEREATPSFGLLDYLVENGFGTVDDSFVADLIGHSWISAGRGRVDVVPAIGLRSLNHPENVLAKLARAYLPDPRPDGSMASFTQQVRDLVDQICGSGNYDLVLFDARAGLHESTAASMIGLGAEALLFGIDQRQTYEGYDLLLAHLGNLPIKSTNDWRERLHFVHAKASTPESHSAFAEEVKRLQLRHLHRQLDVQSFEEVDVSDYRDSFETEWVDEAALFDVVMEELEQEATPSTLLIGDDDRFRQFDPVNIKDSLTQSWYSASFGSFLAEVEEMVGAAPPQGSVLR